MEESSVPVRQNSPLHKARTALGHRQLPAEGSTGGHAPGTQCPQGAARAQPCPRAVLHRGARARGATQPKETLGRQQGGELGEVEHKGAGDGRDIVPAHKGKEHLPWENGTKTWCVR